VFGDVLERADTISIPRSLFHHLGSTLSGSGGLFFVREAVALHLPFPEI